jgi:hypothetical protein
VGLPHPLSREPKEGHTRRRLRGWGSPNSDDWSLALCLLCGLYSSMSNWESFMYSAKNLLSVDRCAYADSRKLEWKWLDNTFFSSRFFDLYAPTKLVLYIYFSRSFFIDKHGTTWWRITHLNFLHETSNKRLLLLSKPCYTQTWPSELCRHIFIPALHPPLILPRCILYCKYKYVCICTCIFRLFPLPPPLMPLTPACKITHENKSQVLLFVTSPFWDLFLNIQFLEMLLVAG